MTRFNLFLTSVFIFLAVVRCSNDETHDPSNNDLEYSAQFNLSYGSDERQKMDVYLPENRNSETKVIVAVHGGGFITGNKEDLNTSVAQLVDDGYAVININYRLVDTAGVFHEPIIHQPSEVTINEQLDDISLAIDFALGQSNEWTVSQNQWAMFGHSAGATLALLYTHSDRNTNGQIKAVGNLAGALDFSFEDESEFAFLDQRIGEILYRAIGAEPVNGNQLAYMAKSPYWVTLNNESPEPTINIRPENDELSPDGGASIFSAYTELLNNKQVPNQYIVIEGADHGFSQPGKWQEATEHLSGFFSNQMQ